MKILVSCYACSPYKGSEPGMGWNFIRVLSRCHELHVIAESKFREDLERYLSAHPEELKSVRFYFIEKERHKTLRKIWPASYYWFYRAWQKKAYRLALKLEEENDFDMVHQLNMVGYREPGYLWKMDKPVVWGPIGGFNITPWRLLPSLGAYGCAFYFFRNVINLCQMHWKRRVRRAMKTCAAIVSATQDTHDAVLDLYGRNTPIIPEVGFANPMQAARKVLRRSAEQKLRLSWSGQHTPRKALNILFKALLGCRCRDHVEVHVIGKGLYTKRWKRMAENMGIGNNIVWHGWIPKKEAIAVMESCHLMAITSLSDLTSTVLLEALSCGLPVIALDHCGFSNVITERCGIKIPIGSMKEVTGAYAAAIDSFFYDEPKRQACSDGAFERASEYSWEGKLQRLNDIYAEIKR